MGQEHKEDYDETSEDRMTFKGRGDEHSTH